MKYTLGPLAPACTPELTSEIVAIKVLLDNNEVLVKAVKVITGATESAVSVLLKDDQAPISAGVFAARLTLLKSV